MKIPNQIVETIEAKYVSIQAEICRKAIYELLDDSEELIQVIDECYVPNFLPGDDGDYLERIINLKLIIDLETGQIKNWRKPDPEEVARFFKLLKDEE